MVVARKVLECQGASLLQMYRHKMVTLTNSACEQGQAGMQCQYVLYKNICYEMYNSRMHTCSIIDGLLQKLVDQVPMSSMNLNAIKASLD